MTDFRFGDLEYLKKDVLNVILKSLDFEDLLNLSSSNKAAREYVLGLPNVTSTMSILAYLNQNIAHLEECSKIILENPQNRMRFFSQKMDTFAFKFIMYLQALAWLFATMNIYRTGFNYNRSTLKYNKFTNRAALFAETGLPSEIYYKTQATEALSLSIASQSELYHSLEASAILFALLIVCVAGHQYAFDSYDKVAELQAALEHFKDQIKLTKKERCSALNNYYNP